MDRGAWWAAVHEVAQSWTRLKRLSMHACIGEGNGNPLQCSCLENPRDRGAWWAAVYGVTQSRTRLKQLSSSNKEVMCKSYRNHWERWRWILSQQYARVGWSFAVHLFLEKKMIGMGVLNYHCFLGRPGLR